MVHQQYLKQVKMFFLPEWKKLTRRWKVFIAYPVRRSLLLGGCRRSWKLCWKAIQFLVINVRLLWNRFLARSTQTLASTTCIYFVVLSSGRGNVLQVAVTLRTVIETLLSQKSSHTWKVLEVWVIIWDTLSFTFETVEEFKYLGTTLTNKNSILEEVVTSSTASSLCCGCDHLELRSGNRLSRQTFRDSP